MEPAWQIFILVCCMIATAIVVTYLHRQAAETSEQVFWANVKQPQIIEQRFATMESQAIAAQEYETAVAKIREHGNQWITSADIHLWTWGNDKSNTQWDFYRWQYLNIERRARLMEAFFAQKAHQAATAKNEAAAAKMWAGGDDAEKLN